MAKFNWENHNRNTRVVKQGWEPANKSLKSRKKSKPRVWPIGRHKGTPIRLLPNQYLEWVCESFEDSDELLATARVELRRRKNTHSITLGKHKSHAWHIEICENGPHYAKAVCDTCQGKWIQWVSKKIIDSD